MFSIIIPTYNNLELFKTAINSVLKQSYADYEIIVTDDSSTNCIEEYTHTLCDTRIRYYHNNPSLGAVRNWNHGLTLAKGDFIVLLHHDEAFESEYHLSNLLKQFSENHLDVIISRVKVLSSTRGNRLLNISKTKLFLLHRLFPCSFYLLNSVGPTACLAIKKKSIKLFNANLKWQVDVDWYYRILSVCTIGYNRQTNILSFDGHSDQITNNINIKEEAQKDRDVLFKVYPKTSLVHFILLINPYISKLRPFMSKYLNFIWR